MKVIIAGSRGIVEGGFIENAIKNSGFDITEVVSGHCYDSPDIYGELYAQAYSLKLTLFVPDWHTFGKSAGPIRNRKMAEYADALIAIWDGKSNGTLNMIREMNKLGKPIHISIWKASEW